MRSKNNKTGYKILLITTILNLLLLILILSVILHNKYEQIKPQYEYTTKIIQLHNTNYVEYVDVDDYLCDEGVITYKNRGYLYMSTWDHDSNVNKIDSKYRGMSGQCMVKLKVRVE